MRIAPLVAALLAAPACNRAPDLPPPAPGGGPRHVDIKVSNLGYAPDRLAGRPGERLLLVFHYDPSAGECGREVLLPPPAEPRRLALTPDRPVEATLQMPDKGELTFTCGMNMLRGTLVVR